MVASGLSEIPPSSGDSYFFASVILCLSLNNNFIALLLYDFSRLTRLIQKFVLSKNKDI